MVQIVDSLTEKEIEVKKRISKLEKIARKMFGTNLRNLWDNLYVINRNEIDNVGIYILPFVNVVKIRDEENYDNALKLAKEYEKQTGEDWALRTDYF